MGLRSPLNSFPYNDINISCVRWMGCHKVVWQVELYYCIRKVETYIIRGRDKAWEVVHWSQSSTQQPTWQLPFFMGVPSKPVHRFRRSFYQKNRKKLCGPHLNLRIANNNPLNVLIFFKKKKPIKCKVGRFLDSRSF